MFETEVIIAASVADHAELLEDGTVEGDGYGSMGARIRYSVVVV
jgi:hypothetical protein